MSQSACKQEMSILLSFLVGKGGGRVFATHTKIFFGTMEIELGMFNVVSS